MDRNIRTLGLLMLIVIVLATTACTSSLVPTNLQNLESKWLKDSVNLHLDVILATPMKGQTMNVSSNGYFMRISNAAVSSALPYYGRLYMTSTTDRAYYMYKAEITDLNIYTHAGKKSTIIKMHAKKGSQAYSIMIEFWDDGCADLYISGLRRDQMIYRGQLSIPSVNDVL